MSRLFVAVRPPASILDAVEALRRPDQQDEPGVRWVPRDQWHVTMRFLGEVDETFATAALDDVTRFWPHGPIDAAIGPRVSRLGRNVICIPVSGLDVLATAVAIATKDVGPAFEAFSFAGHLTLARLRHRGACGLAGHPVRGSFTVGEIELVRSTLPHGGPSASPGSTRVRHEVIGRWPLDRRDR